jgi:hypothetical protein
VRVFYAVYKDGVDSFKLGQKAFAGGTGNGCAAIGVWVPDRYVVGLAEVSVAASRSSVSGSLEDVGR